jgi:hypothetical protein
VEGFRTYRYFAGCKVLRSWICLPLTVGIFERARETIRALLSPRLWSEDGLCTEAGDPMFWDRATLYALRGILSFGDTERAMRLLREFSRRRLLGDRVPYMLEERASKQHLAAESALYARIFTEGLFGITPTGLSSFTLRPRLPRGWKAMALRGVAAFGGKFDIEVSRKGGGKLEISVIRRGGKRTGFSLRDGGEAEVEI